MEEAKTRALLTAFREIALHIISAIGDYLGIGYDVSDLDKRREKRPGAIGGEQARRILDRNEVDAKRLQFNESLDEVRVRVNGTHRVRDHRVHEHPRVVRRANRRLDVPVVVQRVVDGQDADAETRENVGVERDDVVGKELERIEALPARQRVARRSELAAEQRDAAIRVLVQITNADVEDGTA